MIVSHSYFNKSTYYVEASIIFRSKCLTYIHRDTPFSLISRLYETTATSHVPAVILKTIPDSMSRINRKLYNMGREEHYPWYTME